MRDAKLVSRIRRDVDVDLDERQTGKSPSIWLVVARRDGDLGPIATDPRWVVPRVRSDEPVWTDDFSNIVEHFVIWL